MDESQNRLIVTRTGARVLGGSVAGPKMPLPEIDRPHPPTAKPLDPSKAQLAPRANRVAGYTS